MTRSPTSTQPTATLDPATVAAYLDRIGHGPVRTVDRATLASLQDAHVRTVAFENLDIHLGKPLSLDLGALAQKVITDRRGGFCFELNGLFHALLTSLGYVAWLVEARTFVDGALGARFDHARILVDLDGELLVVDVGTGASPRGPIRLVPESQTVGGTTYRVRRSAGHYLSERLENGTWSADWSFDTTPRQLEDFAARCRFHQESPDSHFTHKPLATLVTAEGHITLAGSELITTRHGERTTVEVADPLAVLAERFGMTVDTWPDGGVQAAGHRSRDAPPAGAPNRTAAEGHSST